MGGVPLKPYTILAYVSMPSERRDSTADPDLAAQLPLYYWSTSLIVRLKARGTHWYFCWSVAILVLMILEVSGNTHY